MIFVKIMRSKSQVDLACTAGSPLGAKLASAFETCLGGEEALKPEQVELANYIQSLGLIKFKLSSPKWLSCVQILIHPYCCMAIGQDILLF